MVTISSCYTVDSIQVKVYQRKIPVARVILPFSCYTAINYSQFSTVFMLILFLLVLWEFQCLITMLSLLFPDHNPSYPHVKLSVLVFISFATHFNANLCCLHTLRCGVFQWCYRLITLLKEHWLSLFHQQPITSNSQLGLVPHACVLSPCWVFSPCWV